MFEEHPDRIAATIFNEERDIMNKDRDPSRAPTPAQRRRAHSNELDVDDLAKVLGGTNNQRPRLDQEGPTRVEERVPSFIRRAATIAEECRCPSHFCTAMSAIDHDALLVPVWSMRMYRASREGKSIVIEFCPAPEAAGR